MIKITIEGKQGTGKTNIARLIFASYHGVRQPYKTHIPLVFIIQENEKIPKNIKFNDDDIIIIEKQTGE